MVVGDHQRRDEARGHHRSPPGAQGTVFDGLRRHLDLSHGEEPRRWEAAAIDQLDATVGRLYGPGRYFDTHVAGLDAVSPGPVMLVMNHSGGTTIPDVWGFGLSWYRWFGASRPLHVLGHELIFASPATGRFFERCGVLRATPGAAQRVLGECRRDVLVLPGGDLEAWRPWSERNVVRFAGRTGYARTAIRAQVPIVPVAHVGAHETLMVLRTGQRLARWLGLHRLARAEIWPLHLSLPWGLALGPVPHLPVPARFDYLVGPAIAVPREETAEAVRELDCRVRGAIQAQLDRLAAQRPGSPRPPTGERRDAR